RQRRRGGARASDRRLRRPHPRDDGARAAAERRRARPRRDLLRRRAGRRGPHRGLAPRREPHASRPCRRRRRPPRRLRARRAPASLRRLVPAQGEAPPRGVVGGCGAARGRGGDGTSLRARRARRLDDVRAQGGALLRDDERRRATRAERGRRGALGAARRDRRGAHVRARRGAPERLARRHDLPVSTQPADSPRGPRLPKPPPPRFRFRWWIASIVALLVLNYWVASRATQAPARVRVPYSPFFLNQVTAGHVASITVKGTTVQGTFTKSLSYSGSKPTTRFKTEIPAFADTNKLSGLLQRKDVVVNA